MSHSFTNLLYHLVWSTKMRLPWLTAEVRPLLFACLGDEMREDERMAPGHRLLRGANGAIFVAVRVLHQDSSDKIRAQLTRQIAKRQPFALEVTADLRALGIDRAAAAQAAIDALWPRGLLEMVDLQRGAAHCAGPAGFSRRRRHPFLA